jgi:hypothetical protein
MSECNDDYYASFDKMSAVPPPTWWLPFGSTRPILRIPEELHPDLLREMREKQLVEKTRNDEKMALDMNAQQYIDEGQCLTCGCCFVDEFPFEEMVSCTQAHLFCKTCVERGLRVGLFDSGSCRGSLLPCFSSQGTCEGVFSLESMKGVIPDDLVATYERLIIVRPINIPSMFFF